MYWQLCKILEDRGLVNIESNIYNHVILRDDLDGSGPRIARWDSSLGAEPSLEEIEAVTEAEAEATRERIELTPLLLTKADRDKLENLLE